MEFKPDTESSQERSKEVRYFYLYAVIIFIFGLALTSLYYSLKIYTQNKLLQNELSEVRREKSNLEKKLKTFSTDEENSIIVLLEELLARIEQERTLMEEQVVSIKQECTSLKENLARVEEGMEFSSQKLPEEIPYKVKFIDVAKIGGIYAELLNFGIKDGSFIGHIRNNWANPDFLFIDFEILIEFYNPTEGVDFTCKTFRLKVQNQTTGEFLYKPQTEWVITPQNVEDVRIKIKQMLPERIIKGSTKEPEEKPKEAAEETLAP